MDFWAELRSASPPVRFERWRRNRLFPRKLRSFATRAGAGTAFALGKLGGTFATAGKLEQTFDLPVIGTISHTLTEAARDLARRRMKQFSAATGGLCALFVVLLAVEFIQRGMVA